jgi:type IV secretory pathway TraG/TraD family ATPase VirD4
VGGAFFSKDSFRPEDVVFGNHVFALTMDIDSAVERTQFIRSTEGLFQRLAKKRAPGASNRERRLTVFWDEFSKTAYPGAFDWISEARNYRVTYTVMNQSDDQFRSTRDAGNDGHPPGDLPAPF